MNNACIQEDSVTLKITIFLQITFRYFTYKKKIAIYYSLRLESQNCHFFMHFVVKLFEEGSHHFQIISFVIALEKVPWFVCKHS